MANTEIGQALLELRQTYLQGELSREVEEELKEFIRLLLKEFPSVRSTIVRVVETRAWAETSDRYQSTVQPSQARRYQPTGRARPSDDASPVQPGRKKRPAKPGTKVSREHGSLDTDDASMDDTSMVDTSMVDTSTVDTSTDDTSMDDAGMDNTAHRASVTAHLSPPQSTETEDCENRLGQVVDSNSESEPEPADVTSAPLVTRLASRPARTSMVTPESDYRASPPRLQQRATEMASPVPAPPADLGTSTRVQSGDKRLPLDHRVRLDGARMAIRYGDLHYMAFFFSNALKARRASRRLKPVPGDDASFQERFQAVNKLENQRELRTLQSIYLSAGLAKQWTEEADRQAEQTLRPNLVTRDAALSIFGPLSKHELDNRRKQVNRWQIFERTRRLFQDELGAQSIFAVFAFADSTCELGAAVL
jgi:hypothetical protein